MNAFKKFVMNKCSAMPCPWDQTTLAFVMGIHPSALSQVLKATAQRLNVNFACNLGTALGVDAGTLIDKYNEVKLAECLTPELEAKLAAIRYRAANWKPSDAKQQRSKSWEDGYQVGYQAGRAANSQIGEQVG